MADLADAAAPTTLRTSPLDARHRALGAKMADFGGWSMPIEYPGGGVVREHTAVRERVGVFDVSHLGKVLVRGVGAADYLNTALSNDLGRIAPGQAQYTLVLQRLWCVVDDLIAYLRSPDEVLLVPNAANTAEVVRLLQAGAPASVEVVDQHEAYGVLAVQGPAERGRGRRTRPAHRPRLPQLCRRHLAGTAGHRVPHRLHR
jgi:aminomethyltransferase